MQTNGKFAKGWGVRSPDFVPKGSFVCEYIGEYISDDVLRSNPCLHPDHFCSPPRRSRLACPSVTRASARSPADHVSAPYGLWGQEAESRGIRYDNQKMSRLMDVVGDGKDVVRMCIDATHFSNLGRFLNHSCDPNCFKQRILCDHNSRLPRIAFFTLRDIRCVCGLPAMRDRALNHRVPYHLTKLFLKWNFESRVLRPLEERTYDYGYADVPGKTVPCLCGATNCTRSA